MYQCCCRMSWPDCLVVFNDGTAWISDPKSLCTMFHAQYSIDCIAKCQVRRCFDSMQ